MVFVTDPCVLRKRNNDKYLRRGLDLSPKAMGGLGGANKNDGGAKRSHMPTSPLVGDVTAVHLVAHWYYLA